MPVWKQDARREKEAELIFRGTQYARAISLFQRRHGPGTLPPNLDVLLDEHDLRRKYKDPITNDDFKVLTQGQGPVGPGGRGSSSTTDSSGRGSGSGSGSTTSTLTPTQIGQRATGPSAGPAGVGGIIGVQSKSTDESIKIYNGRNHYNEWAFIFQPPVQAPGTGAPGAPGRQGGAGRGGALPLGPGRGRGGPPTGQPPSRGGFRIGPDGRIETVTPNPPQSPPGGRGPGGQPQPNRRPGG
jgi:hypothetical protein